MCDQWLKIQLVPIRKSFRQTVSDSFEIKKEDRILKRGSLPMNSTKHIDCYSTQFFRTQDIIFSCLFSALLSLI